MLTLIARLVSETEGQDLIEYVLLGTLIALGCIIAMSTVGTAVDAKFTSLGTAVSTAS